MLYEQRFFIKLIKEKWWENWFFPTAGVSVHDKIKRTCAVVGQNHVYLISGYLVWQNLNLSGFQFCLYLICIHAFIKYLFSGFYDYVRTLG